MSRPVQVVIGVLAALLLALGAYAVGTAAAFDRPPPLQDIGVDDAGSTPSTDPTPSPPATPEPAPPETVTPVTPDPAPVDRVPRADDDDDDDDGPGDDDGGDDDGDDD